MRPRTLLDCKEMGITYRQILEIEFQRRVKKNPRYSLRAYARDLGLSASKMSEIMRGLRGMSGRAALRIAERIALPPEESRRFVLMVEVAHARSASAREKARHALAEISSGPVGEPLQEMNAFLILYLNSESFAEARRILDDCQRRLNERFSLQAEGTSAHSLRIRLGPSL
ncbi:MAG: hypothetical protein KF802_06510 [Bdellovibrionaceae bacterium]|nr:hypothetical protein [Pseudobdellovibrionaceae bacterium]MBX3032575.1 hypothetical protein [Pseudobdellovibrionaceae bacterium]